MTQPMPAVTADETFDDLYEPGFQVRTDHRCLGVAEFELKP